MTAILNNDTGKFWSFKDTKNYKNQKFDLDSNVTVIRTFIFDKSFLLKVNHRNTIEYVIPISFTGIFPSGMYLGTAGTSNNKVYFSDYDIIEVVQV